jgi:hypothetical protein
MKLTRLAIVGLIVFILFSCEKDEPDGTVKAYPTSGNEHPFAQSVDDLVIDGDGSSKVSELNPFEPDLELVELTLTVEHEGTTRTFPFTASKLVPAHHLERLKASLTKIPAAPEIPVHSVPINPISKPVVEKGQPEIILPDFAGMRMNFQLLPSDAWMRVRPFVFRLKQEYRNTPQDDDVGVAREPLIGEFASVIGNLTCQSMDQPTADPMRFVEIIINDVTVRTDAAGNFRVMGPFTEVNHLTVKYDGMVPDPSGTTPGMMVSVMNDWHNHRSQDILITDGSTGGTTTAAGDLDFGTLIMTSLDCELYQHGVVAAEEFIRQVPGVAHPSNDDLRIKRWSDVYDGAPYVYHDYIVTHNNFRNWNIFEERRRTIFHEFMHTFRHRADGDLGHWGWDNFRWAYGRIHNGTEIFNEHFAFNEGIAQYWECATPMPSGRPCDVTDFRPGTPAIDPLPQTAAHMDWNEMRAGRRLFDLANSAPNTHVDMMNLLLNNPGSIHTLWEFETAYCAALNVAPFCSGGTPTRVKQPCPPGFADHGATCYQPDVLAKDSYGRGVGTVPTDCGTRERDAGLCYNACPAGFDGVGPVCWQQCPAGMNDDGAFCRRDVNISASDNSACPWFDVCGLTFARGCSTCPPGFQNDGCTCRIDAWIFAKNSFGRGAGEIPTRCPAGQEYDAGLCYQRCPAGFDGVGPVCWRQCPAGFDDHGATCWRPPNILVKF